MTSPLIREVRRVASIVDLPDASIRCSAKGSHVGFFFEDPAVIEIGGWGQVRAAEVLHRCDCSRWRRDVVDLDDGEVLHVEYGGGVLMTAGSQPSKKEARAEYLRRVQSRMGGVADIGKRKRRRVAER